MHHRSYHLTPYLVNVCVFRKEEPSSGMSMDSGLYTSKHRKDVPLSVSMVVSLHQLFQLRRRVLTGLSSRQPHPEDSK